MFEVLEDCLDSVAATKADVVQLRGQTRTITLCMVQNGTIENFSHTSLKGVSARVLVDDKSWGFSSTNHLKKRSVEETLEIAVKLASASVRAKKQKLMLEPLKAEKVNISSSAKRPFEKADLDEAKDIPLEACRGASEAGKKVANAKASFLAIRDQKWFVSSEGSRIFQGSTRLMLMVDVLAHEGALYCPASENLGQTGGLELFDVTPPFELGKQVAERAVRLLAASAPPSGKTHVILHPTICATLLHESIGHPLEADLAMAGGGFGNYVGKQVLSKLVTIYDDGSIERGLGFLPYDDEGVKSKHTTLVENGMLRSFMHDRTSASIMGVSPTGNAHAWDYGVEPLIRQTNIGVEAGDYMTEEMIKDTREGMLIEGTFGGQADASADFTFGFQNGVWIRNGKLGEMTRGANLSGNAIEVLRTVDAVSNEAILRPGACGKGQWAIQGRVVPAMRCEIMIGGMGGQ